MPDGGFQAAPVPPRGFRAYATKRHDGDSFWVMADTGFEGRAEPELRLQDTHAPELLEMRLPRLLQPGGRETTAFVNDWLTGGAATYPGRWYLSIAVTMTTAFEPAERRSFVRYLARVWSAVDWPQPWATPPPADTRSLNYAVTTFLSGHPEWPSGE